MSRKYRQSGYQDEERGERGGGHRRGPQQPRVPKDRLRPDKPGGRGLGAPTSEVFRCAVCGAQQPPPGSEELTASCATCRGDLHTCTHCVHFDTSARFECRQPITERIPRKSKANECTLFTPRVSVEHGSTRGSEKPDPGDARSAFDALFDKL